VPLTDAGCVVCPHADAAAFMPGPLVGIRVVVLSLVFVFACRPGDLVVAGGDDRGWGRR